MRRMATTLALALVIPLTACDRSATAVVEADVSGTYQLQTINGQALPFTLQAVGADRVEITAGHIELDTAGRFEDMIALRITVDGEVELEEDLETGTYVVSGNTVTLTMEGGGSYALLVQGETLTQVVGQYTLVYRR
jgi:hypothetical protein